MSPKGETRRIKPLSETDVGLRWLENFSEKDQPAAIRLVDALTIEPLSKIRTQLVSRVDELVDSNLIETPILLVPVLSIEDLVRISDINGVHEMGFSKDDRPVAFNDYNPGQVMPSMPGSEGFIGSMIRTFVKDRGRGSNKFLPPTASLEELRDLRCRSVLMLSDYSGSGNQLLRFAETFPRNGTIRSWRSSKLLRIYGLTYASSPASDKLLSKRVHSRAFDQLWTVRRARTIYDAGWSKSDLDEVVKLCETYTPPKKKRYALGYRNSGGLFATDAGVPNNVPYILRATDPGWNPFFQHRAVSNPLVEQSASYASPVMPVELLEASGEVRLARSFSKFDHSPNLGLMLLILSILDRGSVDVANVASVVDITVQAAERWIKVLQGLGLVDERRSVTPAGRSELRAARKGERRIRLSLRNVTDAYYPSSLR